MGSPPAFLFGNPTSDLLQNFLRDAGRPLGPKVGLVCCVSSTHPYRPQVGPMRASCGGAYSEPSFLGVRIRTAGLEV